MVDKKTIGALVIGMGLGYALHPAVDAGREKLNDFFKDAREAKAQRSYIENNTDTSNLIKTNRYHIDKNQFKEYLKGEGIDPTQENIHMVAKALRNAYQQIDKPLEVYEDHPSVGRQPIGNASMMYGKFSGVSGEGNKLKLFDINGDGEVSKPISLNSEELKQGIEKTVAGMLHQYTSSNRTLPETNKSNYHKIA